MPDTLPVQRKSFNPWHFIWISIVASELFTALISTIQHLYSPDIDLLYMLRIGFIDALFVPLIIAPMVIYFTRSESALKTINAQLEYEVAERKLAEKALRNSEEKFRSIYENIGIGISLIGNNMEILSLNPQMQKWFPQIKGDQCSLCYRSFNTPPRDTICSYCPTVLTQKDGQVHTDITSTPTPDGIRHYRIISTPLRAADGAVAAAIEMVEDITELAVAEQAIRDANNRLESDVAERTAALKAANERLRSLSVHLQEVREQERTRIAREVHDELGQSLTAIRLELALLRKGLSDNQQEAAEKAASIDLLLESTMNAVKRISLELRPGILDHLGLTAAMEWQAEEFERRTGISCTVTFKPAVIDLDNDRATALFRIFQETLTNVARHAGASVIDARLIQEAYVLTLQVRDNGVGMHASQINDEQSFGLVGIRERIQAWGGTLLITSEPKRGTTVTVQIPHEMKGALA